MTEFILLIILAVTIYGWWWTHAKWRDALAMVGHFSDRAEGLEADLDNAIDVIWKRGGTYYISLNYPHHYVKFMAMPDENGRVRGE